MKPKIPSGWRRLRRGEVIRKGDRRFFPSVDEEGIPAGWADVITTWVGTVADDEFYFRRIRRRKP